VIKLLSKETIDKIAAGEVVERPENVAKELMDNAIDSGATAISVEIRGGGCDLIRVTDNGCGIEKSDLPNAFTRHATSKLTTAEDLSHIRTMGFRGEALASIAGVSRVEMITRRKEDLTGTRYVIEGGNEISVRDIGVPNGTTIIVRDLFFNVPVRRQFLKQPKTEGSCVRDIVEKAALSYPAVSFSFLSDGKQMFHTSGNGKLLDVIYTVYGGETVSHMIPVSYSSEDGTVTGYLSKPSMVRNRRDSEIYFVNGRFVKSTVIERAIETAYEGYLMQHKFPFTVLMIDVAPEKIDVNIHPKKTEIRFSDDEKMFDMVYAAVKDTLSHREHIEDALHRESEKKTVREPHFEPFEKKQDSTARSPIGVLKDSLDDIYNTASVSQTHSSEQKEKTGSFVPAKPVMAKEEARNVTVEPVPVKETAKNVTAETVQTNETYEQLKFLDPEAKKKYRFLGQIFDTYWLIEYEQALYIVDQHAAHEKVNYEKLVEKILNGRADSQNILPVILSLQAKDAVLLEEHLDDFAKAGYEIESAGDRDFYVRAVPASLPELSRKELLMEMIEGLAEIRSGLNDQLIREKIASMSCKAAVKGNNRLSEQEMRCLIDELLLLRDPYNCPHGRPVMIKFTKHELDKLFKRIV